ncbi:MAG: assimilatory sulfite reductase (NADPH) flavoprotein subunit, partial [Woeseiaceae bacterium]|nr:assimilatory sulfite reductase (NADPH) flavoprotein subunit [Woeseiaceae bacterium]
DQAARLNEALYGLSALQLQWASGYAAGMAAANGAEIRTPNPAADTGDALTILYGSQTGNGEQLAKDLEAAVRNKGFAVQLKSLADYKPAQLKRESLLAFVVSTHGEGDPPDDAELFREFLLSRKAPKLEQLQYSVLALGDSSYLNFCQTGREFDARLEELGAKRIAALVECDLDYDADAQGWADSVLSKLPEQIDAPDNLPRLRAVETGARHDKHRPFAAEVLVNQKITAGESSKDVRHIELSLEGSGLHYEPGDSLAIIASNPPELVRQLIDELGVGDDSPVNVDDETLPLGDALSNELEITTASLGFLKSWSALADNEKLNSILADRDQLGELIATHQIIDVVRQFPAKPGAQAFADSLRKLSPRSYSIASSLNSNPDEVHLTVAAVRYDAFGSKHWGAASTFLADRIDDGDTVRVFVEPNNRFRLPEDNSADVIMIGPGTGVAPFRAFVEERAERSADGHNWLFFGDRNFSSDFLYQLEWQRHLKQGSLDRLDVAFSRDQAEKIYVQDRLQERAADLMEWIDRGAFVYVCGDAKQMAGDVDNALIEIISAHRNISSDDAAVELKELRRSGRYQRDVY